jgi:hypothetical protein
MKWTKFENGTIRRNWKKCSDSVLADMLGRSRDVVRAQRCELGLFRTPPKGFVVQVTNWLTKLEHLDFCVKDFRNHSVEYIIAKCPYGNYALFRGGAGQVEFVPEPPRKSWVEHWRPSSKISTGGG